MKASQTARELIEHFEGRRTQAYLDPVGILTGGIGHVIPIGTEYHHEGAAIPDAVIERWFQDDVYKAESIVNGALASIAIELEQESFDALVSLAFNLGWKPFRDRTGLFRALMNDRPELVPKEILRWNRAGGKVLEGLQRRREAEARLFQGLDWKEPPPPPRAVLRRGDRGPAVSALQSKLVRLGYSPLYASGVFAEMTEAAVRAFQEAHRLVVDGEVGEKTLAALEREAGRKTT